MNPRSITALLLAIFLTIPGVVAAYPFGGQIGQIIFCYNNAIYTSVGPPRGGPFIWSPSTKTYQFGPPVRSGQWLLGLAAPPYYCIVSKQPVIVWSGILMTMVGSSGAPASANPGPYAGSGGSGTGSGSGGSGGQTSSGIGHLVVSEVYYRADSSHGGGKEHQWIELFNASGSAIDMSQVIIQTASSSQAFPSGTAIAAGQYMVLAGTTSVRTIWNIPAAAQVLAFPSAFPGFNPNGDRVLLVNSASTTVDAVSYGNDKSAFSPAAPSAPLGSSLIRKTLSSDTDTAADWVSTSAPTPGK